jgi:hypothetical protein
MSVEQIRSVLLWSGIINYAMLILWVAIFLGARDWQHRIGAWFGVSAEWYDAITLAGMTLFKLAIWFFMLIPCIVMYVIL